MKTAYRIYILLCVGIGAFLQAGNPHPDYLLGGFYGLVGSWIGPGMLAKGVSQFAGWGVLGVPAMLGISAAFWLLFFKIARRPRHAARPASSSPVAGSSAFNLLPDPPPGYGWYRQPETRERITRTRTYYEEE